jgi:sugar phosphate isomerase/epimerase
MRPIGDKQKPIGRTATELERIFEQLPEAGLCFDIAHARQFDPSMVEAYRILRLHQPRLRQVHLSEVSSMSRHTSLSYGAIQDFIEVAQWIPPHLPVILESPGSDGILEVEMERAREALPELSWTPA